MDKILENSNDLKYIIYKKTKQEIEDLNKKKHLNLLNNPYILNFTVWKSAGRWLKNLSIINNNFFNEKIKMRIKSN